MMKNKLLSTVSALVLLSLVLCGCMAGQASTQTAPTSGPVVQVQPTRSADRIVSEGVVVPMQFANLSFETQGIVEEVLIAEGQTVKAGEFIAKLKGSAQQEAAVTAAELELLSAEQDLDFLKKNADVARAEVLLRLAQANKALDDATDERQSKSYKRADQAVVDNQRAALILAEDAFSRANDLWSYWKDKDEYDVNRAAALTQFSKAQQELNRARANLNYVEAYPDKFEVDLAEGELQIAQARYDQANRDWELVKDGPNPKELALAEARLANAQAQLEAAKSLLDDHHMTAPFTGTVVTSDIKVGQLVGPQSATLLLADLSQYQVETTDLTELSVVGIQEGSPVKVSFDAITGLELPGKIARISPLGKDKQGDITYTIYIELTRQDARLRWNMTASVVFGGK
jgi:multidrug efflux pump subunit AcrA (membrane-fusion protein)